MTLRLGRAHSAGNTGISKVVRALKTLGPVHAMTMYDFRVEFSDHHPIQSAGDQQGISRGSVPQKAVAQLNPPRSLQVSSSSPSGGAQPSGFYR